MCVKCFGTRTVYLSLLTVQIIRPTNFAHSSRFVVIWSEGGPPVTENGGTAINRYHKIFSANNVFQKITMRIAMIFFAKVEVNLARGLGLYILW